MQNDRSKERQQRKQEELKVKRYYRLLICAMLALSILFSFTWASAEVTVNKTGFPITSEKITLTVLFPRLPVHGDFDQMWFVKAIEEKTNIHLEFIGVDSEGFDEKKNLVLASGDYPDLFFNGITRSDEAIYGPQGIFVNLAPYIEEYAPNAKAMFEKYSEVRKTFTFPDGSLYAMPGFIDVYRYVTANNVYINEQWVTNLGYEMPKNLDELYEVLKAMKSGDPNGNGENDEIPVSTRYGTEFDTFILSALGYVNTRDDVIGGKYVYVPAQEEYKEYLTFMNKLYNEKILDPEYFTQTAEQLSAKTASGLVGMGATQPHMTIADENIWRQYTIIPAITSDANQTPMGPRNSNYESPAMIVTDKCKYPEAAVRLCYFFYSQEGSRMVRGGPEYGTWDGDGGWEILSDTEIKLHTGDYTSFWNFRATQTPLNLPYFCGEDVMFITVAGDAKNTWFSEQIEKSNNVACARFAYPAVSYSEDEIAELSAFIDMDNYVAQMDAQFITGEISIEDGWDNYISTLKNMNLDRMVEIKQAAYDRWNSVD